MFKWTDTSIMPYGKYQGIAMANVPADYLMWLRENGKCSRLVAAYIEENIDVLKKKITEIERKKNNRALLRSMYK